MSIIHTIQSKLTNLQPPHTLLLAVSGGMDSMVLLNSFLQMNLKIEVAHVNYGFRKQAVLEEALVKEICDKNKIPCHILNLNGYEDLQASNNNNLQAYAREERYNFFNKIASNSNLKYIVTAHHALDNTETVLMNILHSSSFLGLRGMNTLEDNIFRPLLDIDKATIEAYANDNNVEYFNDESNNESIYKRNFLRNEVLPLLEVQFPHVKSNLQNNFENWKSIIHFYQKMITNILENSITKSTDEGVYLLKYKRVLKSPYSQDIILILLKKYNYNSAQIEEFKKLTHAQNGAVLENNTFQFIKNNDRITIIDKTLRPSKEFKIFINAPLKTLTSSNHFNTGKHNFTLKVIDNIPTQEMIHDVHNFYLDMDAVNIQENLIIRHHQAGDYFYPFGLNKKKKLSKYFIDKKIPFHQRPEQVVIVYKDYILCVVGYSIDHRFQIKPSTQKILHISIH